MKLNYYPETDSLHISLSDETSTESQEIAPNTNFQNKKIRKNLALETSNISFNCQGTC